jgi:hypothetical protein
MQARIDKVRKALMDSITLNIQSENEEKVQKEHQKVFEDNEIQLERVKSKFEKFTNIIEGILFHAI